MGKKKCGIYVIKNLKNGRRYIGQSVNIKRRFREHILELNRGGYRTEKALLQKDWKDYGEECFDFKIVKLTQKYKLDYYESLYIKKFGGEYNSLRPRPVKHFLHILEDCLIVISTVFLILFGVKLL